LPTGSKNFWGLFLGLMSGATRSREAVIKKETDNIVNQRRQKYWDGGRERLSHSIFDKILSRECKYLNILLRCGGRLSVSRQK
jgi:hypothetical protein